MLLESDSGATILLGPLMALCKLLATLLRYLNKMQIKDPLLREPMNQPVTGNSNIVKMPGKFHELPRTYEKWEFPFLTNLGFAHPDSIANC